jgi:hypothetical protein
MRSHISLLVGVMVVKESDSFCLGTSLALYSRLGRYPFIDREILSTYVILARRLFRQLLPSEFSAERSAIWLHAGRVIRNSIGPSATYARG